MEVGYQVLIRKSVVAQVTCDMSLVEFASPEHGYKTSHTLMYVIAKASFSGISA